MVLKLSTKDIAALLLVLASVFVFLNVTAALNRPEIWFVNMDQDSTLIIDTLRVNGGREPTFIEHPGLSVYFLYGQGLKLLHTMGLNAPVDIDDLFGRPDPILELPGLFELFRHLSQTYLILSALAIGVGVAAASGRMWAGAFSSTLLLGSGGFLLQGLMIRTEAVSIFFVSFAILMLALQTRVEHRLWASNALVLASGFLLELGIFSKMVILPLIGAGSLYLLWYSYERYRAAEIVGNQIAASTVRQNLSLWFVHGLILLGVGVFFFAYVGREALAETKVHLILSGLFCFWMVEGVVGFWHRRLVSGVQILMNFWCGLLLAPPFIYLYCHMETLYGKKYVANTVFSTGMVRHPGYADALSIGPFEVLRCVGQFIFYNTVTNGLLLLVLLAFGISTARGRKLAALFSLCGLGMVLVMSLRWFGLHYLIYPDFFFVLAAAYGLAFADVGHIFPALSQRRKSVALASGALLFLVFLTLRNVMFMEVEYPHYGPAFRDRINYVAIGVSAAPEYAVRMEKRYGSQSAIMQRVISDPRLNGSPQGIQLLTKKNVREDLEKFGVNPEGL